VVPYPTDHIFSIIHKQFRIIGIRTVGRIGQPEILPNHYPVTVASLIKFIIAGLAYMLFYALVGSKNVNKDIPVEE